MLMLGGPAVRADTFQLTVDNCTGGCNPSPGSSMGTVMLTQDTTGGTGVTIVVTLVSPLEFVSSGLNDTIDFNIVGTPTISLASTSNTNFFLASTMAGSEHFDGFGTFEYALGLPGNGAGSAMPSPETFDIKCATCTVANFETNGTGASAFFGVDVYNSATTGTGAGNTGPIGGGTGAHVPDGGMTLMLLGGGLVGLETLRRRLRV
jgi:hypothetical protein